MRWLTIIVALLAPALIGCPVDGGGSSDGREAARVTFVEDTPPAPAAQYPPEAIDYVAASLADPVREGNAALGPAWLTVARLDYVVSSPSALPLRDAVATNLEQAGVNPLPMLCAAWLSTDPAAAEQYLKERLAAGDLEYLDSFWYHPEAGIRALAGLELDGLGERQALGILLLVRRWQRPAALSEQLQVLSRHEAESVSLLATGLLASCGEAGPEQLERLRGAVVDHQRFSNVAEAIKLSGLEEMAGSLVPVAAQMEAGDPDPEFRQHKVSLAAYALTGLPGDQAALMRDRLLGAKDPLTRWQARLGKLLFGGPDTWDAAVAAGGIDDRDLWLALQPEDIADPALLPTLALAARSENRETRSTAVLHLNRYGDYASNQRVHSIAGQLIDDEDLKIRSAAWFSAAATGAPGLDSAARETLSDEQLPPEVRLGAAFYLLRLAEITTTGGETE